MKQRELRILRAAFVGVVILILSVCETLPAQGSSQAMDQLREQIKALKQEIADFEAANADITRLTENIAAANATVETLKSELPELERAARDAEFLAGIYRSAFRMTTDLAPSENLGRLVLVDGTTIEGAVFSGFDQGQVRISGASGIVLVDPAKLQSSLRSRFSLPPELPEFDASFAEIYRAKPEIARSSEEVARFERMAAEEREAEVIAAREEAVAQRDEATTQLVDNIAAQRSHNEAILRRVRDLQAEYAEVHGRKRSVREARAREDAQIRSARIKKAPAEVNRILGSFDSQIVRLEEEERRLQTEIAKLRAQLR